MKQNPKLVSKLHKELLMYRHAHASSSHRNVSLFELFNTGFVILNNKETLQVSSINHALQIIGQTSLENREHLVYNGKDNFEYLVDYSRDSSILRREALLIDLETRQVYVLVNKE